MAFVLVLREVGLPTSTTSFDVALFGVGLSSSLFAEAWERKRAGIVAKLNVSRPRIVRFALYMSVWSAITALVIYLGLPLPTSLFKCVALAGIVYLIAGALVQAFRPVTCR
ncbi:MAG: hypothetical protein EOP50_03055 [Sphingobacteriales bacterium]|nr:MAG: hypothetical protein EOP50_03055 [Sphingobacteriales bacterium]